MKIRTKPARRGRPSTGKAVPAAERMRRFRARRKAAGLRPVTTWAPVSGSPHSAHRLQDARSLALHVVVAQKITRDPRLLEIARANLQRWSAQRQGHLPPALVEWSEILTRPWPAIAGLITEQSENAIRLRQSTPFAGVIKPSERRRIYDAFRT